MRIESGDAWVMLGLVLVLGGLYLFDYRLAIIGLGVFSLLSGIVRLWYNPTK